MKPDKFADLSKLEVEDQRPSILDKMLEALYKSFNYDQTNVNGDPYEAAAANDQVRLREQAYARELLKPAIPLRDLGTGNYFNSLDDYILKRPSKDKYGNPIKGGK